MFFNGYSDSYYKPEEKSRIFRPWDSKSLDNSQDCTVSTTTREDYSSSSNSDSDDEIVDVVEEDTTSSTISKKVDEKPKEKSKKQQPKIKEQMCEAPKVDYNRLDPYSPMYPEMLQANLAQTLGLSSSDPLFMESVAHGYALEEYARVLSQEHQAKLLASKKQRPKKYKCPHCNVGFSNNGQLKGHIRIHTGERPFKCDSKDCGKTFTRNEELTRHKRIHSGLRPFPCGQCGKRFGRKDHLKKHCRTHMQPRGVYAVPVMMPFDAWASGQTGAYPFVPMLY